MTFGEKVRSLRKEKKMSQQELASMVGVSYRTIRSWEVEGRFPKQNVLYQKLADALQCDVSYLMSENEAFITEASEQFGNRGAKQAQQILEQAAAMFEAKSIGVEPAGKVLTSPCGVKQYTCSVNKSRSVFNIVKNSLLSDISCCHSRI